MPGYLLNQYSLSEQDGDLRVATTSEPVWWNGAQAEPSRSMVTVLRRSAGGVLAKVGQVDGLGHGQRIYSVRFAGDIGYVVTFRQVDPLYVIDLSDPSTRACAGSWSCSATRPTCIRSAPAVCSASGRTPRPRGG